MNIFSKIWFVFFMCLFPTPLYWKFNTTQGKWSIFIFSINELNEWIYILDFLYGDLTLRGRHNCFWGFMVFNATSNNISVISWRTVILVEETGVSGENHRPVASHCQTSSHNVVSSTLRMKGVRTYNFSGDIVSKRTMSCVPVFMYF